jgi:diazepam-binding inhibitor (GABA receptor modulating acyl-CoA-binding protein)
MSDIKKKFEKATTDAKALPERPSDETMLELYALFKQSTAGDVAGDRPGMFDLVGKAKYDAWSKQKGKTKDAAMQAYVNLVESLKKKK